MRNLTVNEGRQADLTNLRALSKGLPFEAYLFKSGFSIDSEGGLDSDYTLQVVERVSVCIWGATSFNHSLIADYQGMGTIPNC